MSEADGAAASAPAPVLNRGESASRTPAWLRQVKFALRSLARDLRAGELRVLGLALCVAVASVTAVGFFTDRIGRAVERQAGDVLAADLTASSGFVLPEALDRKSVV